MNYGHDVFKKTMARNTFTLILRCLRFYDRLSRQQRIANDKFAPLRDFWDQLIKNFQEAFRPSPRLTIDESLVGCKSRCSFIQYISSKSDKFGLKFFLLVDWENNYVLNDFPYII